MAKYVLEFEKGGSFEIRLDENAPVTAAAFDKFLSDREEPYQALCLQGRFSGSEMYFSADLGSTGEENNIPADQGSVCFNPDPEWSAICIFWGPDIQRKRDHWHNHIGVIASDLDEFEKVGIRIWQKGGEIVTLKKVE